MRGMSRRPWQRYGVDPDTDGEVISLCLLALGDLGILETAVQPRGVQTPGNARLRNEILAGTHHLRQLPLISAR